MDAKEVTTVNKYLDRYLKYTLENYGIKEFKKSCNKILNFESIRELDKYSKEILAINLEKLIMISLEKYRLKNQAASYWQHFKVQAPLVLNSEIKLNDYIDLLAHDFDKKPPKTKEIVEIKHYYDKQISKALKSFTNKKFELPSGEKVSINDLIVAVNRTINSSEIIKLEHTLARTKKQAQKAAYTGALITLIGVSAIASSKIVSIAKEGQDIEIDVDKQRDNIDNSIEEILAQRETITPTSVNEVEEFIGYENTCPKDLQKHMMDMSKKYNVPFNVIMTIADIESGSKFNTNGVVSYTDDYGQMQINKCNFELIEEQLGYTEKDILTDPYKNIEASTWLLSTICKMYESDIKSDRYENIYGTYNGWINWKEKEMAVEYATKAVDKMDTCYNKTEEELITLNIEVENARRTQ